MDGQPDAGRVSPPATTIRLGVRLALSALVLLGTWTGCVASRSPSDTLASAETVPASVEPVTGVEEGAADAEAHDLSIPALARPFFEDGPLANARDHFDNTRWASAADAFAAALEDVDLSLSPLERQAGLFLKGIAERRAKRYDDAERTLLTLADEESPLAPYGALHAAEAALSAKRSDTAGEIATRLVDDPILGAHAQVIVGLSLAQEQHYDAALTILQPLTTQADLGPKRRALLGTARALVALTRTEEAVVAYETLIKSASKSTEGRAATKELNALVPKAERKKKKRKVKDKKLDAFARAQRHYKAHRSEKAIAAFKKIAKKTDKATHPERWCEATYLIGKSHTKLRQHDKASGYYDAVIKECSASALHVKAHYNSGRAHWNAGRKDDAINRFYALIHAYPEDSLADDCYLYVARLQFEKGEPERAEHALRQQMAAYPKGDMIKDAHWLLLRQLYTSARFAEAATYAADNEASAAEDDVYTKGRMAYFRARALEHLEPSTKAKPSIANDAFSDVVERFPLSYYGMLAFGRLGIRDAARAATLQARLREAPFGGERDHIRLEPAELLEDPTFQRGLALARLGFVDWAQAELDTLDARYREHESFTWTLAALYDTAGATTRSHRLAAGLTDSITLMASGEARAKWALAYPRPYFDQVQSAATKQGLTPELVYSIMREESGFKPHVESWANARGLMQLMLPTAQSVADLAGVAKPSADDLFEPATSIPLGAAYLGKLARRYAGHPIFTIAGYNGGQGNVGRWLKRRGTMPLDMWVEDIPYGQTRKYTKRVATTWWRYNWLYPETGMAVAFDPTVVAAVAAGVDEDRPEIEQSPPSSEEP